MGTYTANYQLYMPTVGEQGWGELINGNYQTIDTTMKSLSNRLTTCESTDVAYNTRITALEAGEFENVSGNVGDFGTMYIGNQTSNISALFIPANTIVSGKNGATSFTITYTINTSVLFRNPIPLRYWGRLCSAHTSGDGRVLINLYVNDTHIDTLNSGVTSSYYVYYDRTANYSFKNNDVIKVEYTPTNPLTGTSDSQYTSYFNLQFGGYYI